MQKIEIREKLKNSDIERIREIFYGDKEEPNSIPDMMGLLDHLNSVQSLIDSGDDVPSQQHFVRLENVQPGFEITPQMASYCNRYGIGVSYEPADARSGLKHISGSELMRLCTDPQVQCDSGHGSMVGNLSNMPTDSKIMSVIGDSLTLYGANNASYKIPVTLAENVQKDIASRRTNNQVNKKDRLSPVLAK